MVKAGVWQVKPLLEGFVVFNFVVLKSIKFR